ncbi:MAG: hypothetical protein WCJ29_03715 [bacterium]
MDINYLQIGADIKNLEPVAFSLLLLGGFFVYSLSRGCKWLIGIAVILHVSIPVSLAIMQYKIWALPGHGLTNMFLPPHQPITYWLLYSWTNFTLDHVLALLFAFGVAIICFALAKYRENIFLPQEPYLIVLCSLIIGWPRAIFLIPMVLVLAALSLAVEKIWNREARMVIGLWALFVSIFIMAFGSNLISVLHLGALRIGQ